MEQKNEFVKEGDILFESKFNLLQFPLYKYILIFGFIGFLLLIFLFNNLFGSFKKLDNFESVIGVFFVLGTGVISVIFIYYLFLGFIKGFNHGSYLGHYFHDKIVIHSVIERDTVILEFNFEQIKQFYLQKDGVKIVYVLNPLSSSESNLSLEFSKKYKKCDSEIVDFLNKKLVG